MVRLPIIVLAMALGSGCSLAAAPPPASPPVGTSAPAVATNATSAPVAPAPSAALAETPDAPDEPADADPDDAPDDEVDDELDQPVGVGEAPPHPLDGLSDEAIAKKVQEDIASLGSMSVGRTNGGLLINGVPMPEDPRWKLTDSHGAWGTQETVDAIATAVGFVHAQFPNTPPIYIGHISGKRGGPLSPHVSHQSGRDVDIGYFYLGEDPRWFRRATKKNLDVHRSWALVRAFITETDVALILIDHSIQRLLRRHAESIGENAAWLDRVFRGGGGRPALIRHAKGHATHIHVRFFNPVAQETARRAYLHLIESETIKPPKHYVRHRVRRGETLGKLARRYDTTIKAIRDANRLRSTKIIAGRVYRIPKEAKPVAPKRRLVPPRVLPPPSPAPG